MFLPLYLFSLQGLDRIWIAVSPEGKGNNVFVCWNPVQAKSVKSIIISKSRYQKGEEKIIARLPSSTPYFVDKLSAEEKKVSWYYIARLEYFGKCWFAWSEKNEDSLKGPFGKYISAFLGNPVSDPAISEKFISFDEGSDNIPAPANLLAIDKPNDKGDQIDVTWPTVKEKININFLQIFQKNKNKENLLVESIFYKVSGKEQEENIQYYDLFRKNLNTGKIEYINRFQSFITSYRDQRQSFKDKNKKLEGYRKMLQEQPTYKYYIRAISPLYYSKVTESKPAKMQGQWFNMEKIVTLFAMIIITASLFYYIKKARTDANLYIRPLAGLKEIDNAVGRATEMGRPILFVPGLSSIADIATIAGLNILAGVAKKAAEYDTPLFVPLRDYIVLPIAQEIVKSAYSEAGRPDAYKEQSVFFVSPSQFAYVAGVAGLMAREKPATNFFMGMFWAESLILTEKGNEEGCIQIAGSDAETQLPFFITTCDFTLIGEELYAASAYISRDPLLVGTIKAQDLYKLFIIGSIILGVISTTLAELLTYPALNFFKMLFPVQ